MLSDRFSCSFPWMDRLIRRRDSAARLCYVEAREIDWGRRTLKPLELLKYMAYHSLKGLDEHCFGARVRRPLRFCVKAILKCQKLADFRRMSLELSSDCLLL